MTDLTRLENDFETRLKELKGRAEAIDDELAQPGDDDWDENAVESEGDEVAENVGNMMLAEIRQIQSVLAQIKAGTYGTCVSCGESIAPKRLEAMPQATRCVACASSAKS